MPQFTVQEMADKFKIDRTKTYGFVTFMVEAGFAECVGVRRIEGARGKGANVFTFKKGAMDKLGKMVTKFVD